MTCTRRDFLKRSALFGSAAMLPGTFLRALYASPAATNKNLVLLELAGGCDGLSLVVPHGVNGGTYYSDFRPTLNVPQGQVLQIDGQVGLHPSLGALKAHYDAGRLAIIQGVSYANPDFSHEVAQNIWATGDPGGTAADGWLARLLAQFTQPGFPWAMDVAGSATRIYEGAASFVPAFSSTSSFKFPTDSDHWDDKASRRATYEAIIDALKGNADSVATMSATSSGVLQLIDTFATIPDYTFVGTYPDSYSVKGLKLVAELLNANLGMRVFHMRMGGFDTHADQELDGYFTQRMAILSQGIDALWADLVNLGQQNDTIIVVYSEFGRTVYENGSGGTDHGSVNPVLVLGGSVTGGLVTAHPAMDPFNLDPDGELPMVADFRDVFGTIASRWYAGNVAGLFPGHTVVDLGFLP